VRSFFNPPPYEKLENYDAAADRELEFQSWYRYNTRQHKVPGYRAVFVSLKKHGTVPGDMTSEQMEAVADLAEKQSDLYKTWTELKRLGLAMPNIGTLTDMIACPGLDFCSLANAGTLNVADSIQKQFDDLDYLYDLGDIEVKMSGCMNACGHHHVGHIGILGVDKHGEEWYQITLGGSVNGFTALGDVIGPSVRQNEVASTLQRIVDVYRAKREDGERFIETYRRIGVKPFKEHVYAQTPAAA
jgi:sulfite reductase (NADPH) hemoprotein beta-component